jgi:hypothetical protein
MTEIVNWPFALQRPCVHGMEHPTPESVAYLDEYGPIGLMGSWAIHECDGCCRGDTPISRGIGPVVFLGLLVLVGFALWAAGAYVIWTLV